MIYRLLQILFPPLGDAVGSLKKTSSAYGTVYYLIRDALSTLLKREGRAGVGETGSPAHSTAAHFDGIAICQSSNA